MDEHTHDVGFRARAACRTKDLMRERYDAARTLGAGITYYRARAYWLNALLVAVEVACVPRKAARYAYLQADFLLADGMCSALCAAVFHTNFKN